MDGLFGQLTSLGSGLALVCGLLVLWRRGVEAYISAFRWQSTALAAVAALVAYFGREPDLYVIAALFFALKAVVMPILLGRMCVRLGVEREERPYVNTATSLIAAGLLVLLAYVVARPLASLTDLPTRPALPLAMGIVFVGLFVVVSRKKAVTQVVGFLAMENGIALVAILATYGVPLVVELGVFLDALMGFLVMQVFVYHIRDTFETLDVEQLQLLTEATMSPAGPPSAGPSPERARAEVARHE